MNLDKHRKIAGSLLMIFAVVNLFVSGIMLSEISELSANSNQDQMLAVFVRLTIAAVVGTILLLLFQLFAGYRMIRNGSEAYLWGLVGSIIAILCGISLPAGVYSLWVNLKSRRA